MNQRDIRWFDMPKQSERRPKQYYIMWAYESPSYPGMNIHQLDNYFNWTMTYRRDSDFPFPYGRVVQTKKHPPLGSPELAKIIDQFGKNNIHLARNRTGAKAAWFVSNCATHSKRERLVKELQNFMPIQVMLRFGCIENLWSHLFTSNIIFVLQVECNKISKCILPSNFR